MKSNKRIQVSFTSEQWELIENLKGELGNGDSEIIRNIVLMWLGEKSFLSSAIKKKRKLGDFNEI